MLTRLNLLKSFMRTNSFKVETNVIETQCSVNEKKQKNKYPTNDPSNNKNKILLMGPCAAGKTSIKSVLFYHISPRNCARLSPTIKIVASSVYLFGDYLTLNVWDCGGCDKFLQSYFSDTSQIVFSNVAMLVYVFDISKLNKHNYANFSNAMECLNKYSPDAEIHCLSHKIDAVNISHTNTIKNHQIELNNIANIFGATFKHFYTSIWDESLHIWASQMLHPFVFNPLTERIFRDHLYTMCDKSLIHEIALFESSIYVPFLHLMNFCDCRCCLDRFRMQKISTMIKRFDLKCNNVATRFCAINILNTEFSVYIEKLTERMYVLFVISNGLIESEAVRINLNRSKKQFEELLYICAKGIVTKTMLYSIVNHWLRTLVCSVHTEKHLIDMVAFFYPMNVTAASY